MDDLTLIGHMAGGGQALATKLRGQGFSDVTHLLEQDPAVLAKKLDVSEAVAQRIVRAARALQKVGPPRPKPAKQVVAASKSTKRIQKRTASQASKRAAAPAAGVVARRVKRNRYWKIVGPILGVGLIGLLFRRE
jgi:hypothetical protein